MIFTIGADVELAVRSVDTGRLVSAIPFFPAKKREPEPLPGGSTVVHDNVSVEFATPICRGKEEFIYHVCTAVKDIRNELGQHYRAEFVASGVFDKAELKHEDAMEFGCDPDYDAWDVCVNDKPYVADECFRSFGGHIHIGSDSDVAQDPYGKLSIVKAEDIVMGVTSVMLDHSDEAKRRRSLYGKAGCHRPKDYGVEYRVLSNFWASTPFLISVMFDLVSDALGIAEKGGEEGLIKSIGKDRIRDCINNSDAADAHEIFNIVYPHLRESKKVASSIWRS